MAREAGGEPRKRSVLGVRCEECFKKRVVLNASASLGKVRIESLLWEVMVDFDRHLFGEGLAWRGHTLREWRGQELASMETEKWDCH